MDNNISDDLKCPICFEVPKNEIFQCNNGHTICRDCVANLAICPQCRVPYEVNKIRNRALETILDKIELDCVYKSEGCTAKISRQQVVWHTKNCLFSVNRINLCEQLGYTCGYIINLDNIQQAVTHFKRMHNSSTVTHSPFSVALQTPDNKLPTHVTYTPPPIIVNQHGQIFLVIYMFKKEEYGGYLHCIRMTGVEKPLSKDIRAEFLFRSQNRKECPDLIWNGPPTFIKNSISTVKHPIFRLPVQLSPNFIKDGQILYTVTIEETE